MMNEIIALRSILQETHSGVFFGGAGVSTESGIPDFRSADGLYRQKGNIVPPETVLSHDFFWEHTKDFYAYYCENLLHPKAKPNPAHIALARLEEMGKIQAVITQNIDGLHQMAGSKTVFELHGTVKKNRCSRCLRRVDTLHFKDGIAVCPHCGSVVKPEVVLYGEALPQDAWRGAEQAVAEADTLIVGGTSLTVYPASMLVSYFKGRHLVIINRDMTSYDPMADLVIRRPIGEVLGQAVEGM